MGDHFQLTKRQKAFSRISESPNAIVSLFLSPKHRFSNRRNGVRVSKNRENLKIEFICLDLAESSGEQPPTLRKMFRGRLGVEKSIFLNPYFGSKRNFEWN